MEKSVPSTTEQRNPDLTPFWFTLSSNGKASEPEQVEIDVKAKENHATVSVTHHYNSGEKGTGNLSIRKPNTTIPVSITVQAEDKSTTYYNKPEATALQATVDKDSGVKYQSFSQESLSSSLISLESVPLNSKITFVYIIRVSLESAVYYNLHIPKEVFQNEANNSSLKSESGKQIAKHTLTVQVNNACGVQNLQADLEAAQVSGNSLKLENATTDADLNVTYEKEKRSNTVVVFGQSSAKDDRLLYLRIDPGQLFLEKNIDGTTEIPTLHEFQGIVHFYVIDRSENMIGKLGPALQNFELFLDSLPENSLFNVVSFGSEVEYMFASPALVEDGREEAIQKVKEMGADMGVRNFVGFIDDFKKNIIANDDYEYSEFPNRIYILSDGEIDNPTATFQTLGEAASLKDVKFYYIGLGTYLKYQVIRGFASEGSGQAEGAINNDEVANAIGNFCSTSAKPYLKLFQLNFGEYQEEFEKNIDTRISLSRVKDLNQEIEILTKFNVPESKKDAGLPISISFVTATGDIINEPLKVQFSVNNAYEYLSPLYNYKTALEEEKLYAGPAKTFDACGGAPTDIVGGVKVMKIGVYLDGTLKFAETYDVSMTVESLLAAIAKKLGQPVEGLSFTTKDKPVNFTGTVEQNLTDFEETIEVKRVGGGDSASLDTEILKKAKDGMWEYNEDLWKKMGNQPEDWEKFKATITQNNAKLGGGFTGWTAPVTNSLFTLYVMGYLKAKFPKKVGSFAAIFAKSQAGLQKNLKGFNPNVPKGVEALAKIA